MGSQTKVVAKKESKKEEVLNCRVKKNTKGGGGEGYDKPP